MNIIDIQFKKLVKNIKNDKNIFNHIKNRFTLLPEETKKSCEDFFNKFLFWGKLDMNNNEYEFFKLKEKALTHYLKEYVWLYDNLEDYQSKKILLAILDN